MSKLPTVTKLRDHLPRFNSFDRIVSSSHIIGIHEPRDASENFVLGILKEHLVTAALECRKYVIFCRVTHLRRRKRYTYTAIQDLPEYLSEFSRCFKTFSRLL